jgi:hypothetical protein
MKHLAMLRAAITVSIATALVLGVAPAEAAPPGKPPKPPKPSGAVSGLTMAVTHESGYRIDTRWNSLPGATRYAVRMVDGSATTLATDSVRVPSWSGTTSLPAGTRISVTVTPYADRKKGKPATVTKVLPDVTAPRGVYTVERDAGDPTGGAVTIRRDELVDDLTPLGGIVATIAWDEGESPQPWPSGTATMSHDYGNEERLYRPVVTVQDAAGNTATYRLAVPVRDTLAPTGSYAVTPGAGFAGWTGVRVSETQVSDNLSADADIKRTVDWGDGTVEAWNPQLTHVYADAGSYLPRLRLTDEAGNASSWMPASTVVVTRDDAAPTTTLRVARKGAARITSWSTLRGRLDDAAGVGAKEVNVKVAQQRRKAWFAYHSTTGTWTKAAGKRAALRKASGIAGPTATGHWALPVKGLRTGQLVVRYRGEDLVGNRTGWMVRQQRLTKR